MATHAEIKQKTLHKYLGKEFETTKSGKCFVVDYVSITDVTVAFYNPICFVKCRLFNLKSGKVSNPLAPVFHGRGYMGIGDFTSKNNKAYSVWSALLTRSYNKNFVKVQPTYEGVEVCEEWYNFQNFAHWFHGQKGFNMLDDKGNKFQLDKDILGKGSKTYSPQNCCFVPQEINNLFTRSKSRTTNLPRGVTLISKLKKYKAAFGDKKYLGAYDTPEEAFEVYKKAKEAHLKDLAEKWKDKIDNRAYQALISYEVNITD